jgi:hypothetical protein
MMMNMMKLTPGLVLILADSYFEKISLKETRFRASLRESIVNYKNKFFKYFFGVPRLANCIFLIFYNEPELGAEIDPGMVLTPLPSCIGLDGDRTHDLLTVSRVLHRNKLILWRQSGLVVSKLDSQLKLCGFQSLLIQNTRWNWGQSHARINSCTQFWLIVEKKYR